ncbi:dynein regulatory complex protein 10 isoform X2 [Elgaria multicarinata webbii]|uniref:dynein regulatory complex protein 10 isoform X2 n=1 Tax=Elgaria multicarinata webbii TaxID=159646 RepID=UPI002FCD2826
MATEVLHQSYECIDPNRGKRQVYRMPLKILDPGRSKLTTVETKRIISVLDETILKVELVSTFSHVTENLEEFSAVLGPELTGALKEHLRLSNTMEATLARLEGEGVLQNGGAKGDLYGAEDPGGYLTLHVQGLRSSVRNIVRLFFANPMACQAVREVAHTRHPNANLFIKSLSELRGFLFEKLLTTPLEEKEKRRFMKEISQRDKKNMEIIAALMEELTAAIQNRDDEKKYKVEMEIENWVQKYDIEMIEKQEEIEEIDVVYTVEKAQLAELREKFALLDQEYSQIKEERRVRQEQREKAEKEMAILVRAATLIQALWKGYLVRSLLRSKRKKKGKGKKGGRK